MSVVMYGDKLISGSGMSGDTRAWASRTAGPTTAETWMFAYVQLVLFFKGPIAFELLATLLP
jgi:hypothetical protein